jgi:hypothetical protein
MVLYGGRYESTPLDHSIEEADPALQYVMNKNHAGFWEDDLGRILIHKPKRGRGAHMTKSKCQRKCLPLSDTASRTASLSRISRGFSIRRIGERRRAARPVRR